MARQTWDETWAAVARAVAGRSACGRAQVGAVLVSADNRIISTGYNGPAAGSPADTSTPPRLWCQREAQGPNLTQGYGFACPSIHAEVNALLYRHWGVKDLTLYVTHSPCADCAKVISNSGVTRIVLLEFPPEHRPDPTAYLESCGIVVEVL